MKRSFLTFLCVSLLPATAFASGLDAPALGPGSSGPTTCDPVAVYWNPAALTCLKTPQVILGGALVLAHVSYTRERRATYQSPDSLDFKVPIEASNVDASKTGESEEVSTTPFAPVGDLFIGLPLTKDLVAGFGAYVPYAAALDLPDDGPQAFQVRGAFIAISHVTLSGAYRVAPQFSVGAGVTYVGGFAELSKLQDFAAMRELGEGLARDPIRQENDFGPDAPPEVRELDTLARPISLKRAFSNGITGNIGVLYQPTKDISVALNYQHSAAMRFKGDLSIDMNTDFFTKDLSAQGIRYAPLIQADAELAFDLPKRLTLGGSYRINDTWELAGFLSWVMYSDLEAFEVTATSKDLAQPKLGLGDSVKTVLPRDWNDTVWVEGTARMRLNKTMRGWGTLGYQSPASPDHTIDMASPDGHRLIGGVGGELVVDEGAALIGDLRVQGILPRHVVASDYDLANGTYGLVAVAAGGHLRVDF